MATEAGNWFTGFPVAPSPWLTAAWDALPGGFRAIHPDDLHVTLAFFGGVGEARALAGWNALLQHPPPAARVTLGRLAAFGSPRRPSAYGFDLAAGHEALIAWMAAQRDCVIAAAGGPPEHRPPRPHLTIARPPHRAGARERRATGDWMRACTIPETCIALARVALYGPAPRAPGAPRFCIVREAKLRD